MIFHVFIQPDYMYALLKELTNNYHKNVKCRVQKLNIPRIRITSVFSKENKGIGDKFFNGENTNQSVEITRWVNEIRFWLHYCCYLEHQHAISGPLLKKGLVNTWIYCLIPTFILADNMNDEVVIVTATSDIWSWYFILYYFSNSAFLMILQVISLIT